MNITVLPSCQPPLASVYFSTAAASRRLARHKVRLVRLNVTDTRFAQSLIKFCLRFSKCFRSALNQMHKPKGNVGKICGFFCFFLHSVMFFLNAASLGGTFKLFPSILIRQSEKTLIESQVSPATSCFSRRSLPVFRSTTLRGNAHTARKLTEG